MATLSDNAQQLVVTGSSAGGIEALSTLVSSLPGDFPAPVVVAQHLDPNTHSMLSQILAKHSALPIRIVEAHEQLRPGNVFVVPANRHVTVTDHEVAVSEQGPKGVRPSVDLLFSTAATIYGERLIAVILSGMGSDGVVGARMVKKNGGTVIVQDPDTAMFPSMPLSLPKTSVDFSVKVENIGPLINDLLRGTYLAPVEEQDNPVRALLSHVREISGIDFGNYKMPTILRRLSRLMVAAGCNNVQEYTQYLRKNPDGYQRLISAFLIRVTEFFRDPELFSYLRSVVLPQIVKEAKENSRDIRMWSAGCATGEEAYSLAIAVAELLGDGAELHNVRVFATDLDNDAVSFGRRGIYAEDALRDVPPEILKKYFMPVDGAYEVAKRVRSMVVFGQHDLGQRAPFPHLDLVLCRNVLIYFTKELQNRTLHLFAYSLRPGGYLALGKSETTAALPEYFASLDASMKVFVRRGERVPLIIGQAAKAFPGSLERPSPAPPRFTPPKFERPARTVISEDLGGFLMRAPIGVIVVDRHYDIQTLNAMARELLSIRTIGAGEDLIHLLDPEAGRRIKQAIDGALRSETPTPLGTEIETINEAGKRRNVRIMAYAGKAHEKMTVHSAFLLISDVTDIVVARNNLEGEVKNLQGQLQAISTDRSELVDRQRMLIEANNELTKANLELLADNERLMISVEEAQSATEEIETLNEEMQATNEELETVNEELQATVEELNTTNDELEARTVDLQNAAASRETARIEAEQWRLDLVAAFDNVKDAIAILDGKGQLAFANAAFRELQQFFAAGQGLWRLGDRQVAFADLGASIARNQDANVKLELMGDGKPKTLHVQVVKRDGESGAVLVIPGVTG